MTKKEKKKMTQAELQGISGGVPGASKPSGVVAVNDITSESRTGRKIKNLDGEQENAID